MQSCVIQIPHTLLLTYADILLCNTIAETEISVDYIVNCVSNFFLSFLFLFGWNYVSRYACRSTYIECLAEYIPILADVSRKQLSQFAVVSPTY